MKIVITDKVVIIEEGDKEVREFLRKEFTFEDDSLKFVGGRYNRKFIKEVSLLRVSKIGEKFLTGYVGLASDIFQILRERGVEFSVEDKRTRYKFQGEEVEDFSEYLPKFKYMKHQEDALRKMVRRNRGIIKAPTSSGKSNIIIGYIKIAKLRVLLLVDKISLGIQLKNEIEKNGLTCGICNGKGIKNEESEIMVSTIQSVNKVDVKRYEILLVDECHHLSSKTYQKFLKENNFNIIFGFSASPYNNNLLKYNQIKQFCGGLIYDIKPEILIENNVMSKPEIRFIETICEETLDYLTAYENGIVNNEVRNKQIVETANKYENFVLILVTRIEHGNSLQERIENSYFLDGSSNNEEREKIIKDFNDGKIHCLIASTILDEGISISNIEVLIMASSQKSLVKVQQRLGRLLRYSSTKKQCIFYDFIDKGNYFLQKHSNSRKNIYKKLGFL